MPSAPKFPTTLKGWLVTLAGSMAGLLAGFATINWLTKVVK